MTGSIVSTATVESGATIGGSGTIGGLVVNSGGTVAPGVLTPVLHPECRRDGVLRLRLVLRGQHQPGRPERQARHHRRDHDLGRHGAGHGRAPGPTRRRTSTRSSPQGRRVGNLRRRDGPREPCVPDAGAELRRRTTSIWASPGRSSRPGRPRPRCSPPWRRRRTRSRPRPRSRRSRPARRSMTRSSARPCPGALRRSTRSRAKSTRARSAPRSTTRGCRARRCSTGSPRTTGRRPSGGGKTVKTYEFSTPAAKFSAWGQAFNSLGPLGGDGNAATVSNTLGGFILGRGRDPFGQISPRRRRRLHQCEPRGPGAQLVGRRQRDLCRPLRRLQRQTRCNCAAALLRLRPLRPEPRRPRSPGSTSRSAPAMAATPAGLRRGRLAGGVRRRRLSRPRGSSPSSA